MPFTTIDDVYDQLERMSRVDHLSGEDRRVYERELKYYRDTYNKWKYALTTGQEQGRAEGRAESRREIAVKLKDMGLNIQAISQATGLTAEELLDI